jgi:hypothetical protein
MLVRSADRVRRLEQQRLESLDLAADSTRAQADAAQVTATLLRYAENFDDRDSAIPLDVRRSTMSPAEHFAWGLRFEPEPTPLATVMQIHGFDMPSETKEKRHAHH